MLNSHDQVLRLLVWGSQRLHPERERCFDLLVTTVSNVLEQKQKAELLSNSPAHSGRSRASVKIVLPAILPQRIKPSLRFMMLRRQKSNLTVCPLDRTRLAATARKSNTCVHDGSEPGVCVRDLFAFPSGAIASVSYVFLDEVDVVKHRVKNILLRGDGEFSTIEARC
jgi:hypothetical protein